MAIISPRQVVPGNEIKASDVNDPVNTITTLVNGNLDQANLADGAVTSAKIGSAAVKSQNIDFTTTIPGAVGVLKTSITSALGRDMNITTTDQVLYTATDFCYVSIYSAGNPNTTVTTNIFINGVVRAYMEPRTGRETIGLFLNKDDVLSIRGGGAYTTWMQITIFKFVV
jgi:hypothetical protein